MAKKLKLILLIDDDEATNYLHRIIIREADCAEDVHVVLNGKKALEYLKSAIDGHFPKPDLIFLDINMPVMNGWEFLMEYSKLDKNQKAGMVLVMVTTSINPDDRKMAETYSDVSGFRNKPLTVEMLHEIVDEYFSDITPTDSDE